MRKFKVQPCIGIQFDGEIWLRIPMHRLFTSNVVEDI